MIHYKIGNLLESEAEALVNTVNTEGVMGKGIALQFKNLFPNNYKIYAKACKNKELNVGKLLVTEEENLLNKNKIIINLPTKTKWRLPSEYLYIEEGLKELRKIIKERNIKSIAIPPLGAGNGGLNWNKVKQLLEKYLTNVDCDIYIYEPSDHIQEVLKKERVNLTAARAMLLSVLYDLVCSGEFVSEFSSEKIAYFLQRFGATDAFNLEFQPNFYGPYSGKVKHVLYYLNGSYIMGYSSKDRKPFAELDLIGDAEDEIDRFLSKAENIKYKNISNNVKEFLNGFYSNFALELLSTIDYLILLHKTTSFETIKMELDNWSNRKKTLFNNPDYISIAINHLKDYMKYAF